MPVFLLLRQIDMPKQKWSEVSIPYTIANLIQPQALTGEHMPYIDQSTETVHNPVR